jgi:hypothetical protein
MAIGTICFNIFLEMIYSSLPYGGLLSKAIVGGSVARASAANESIIRLTHNN